LFWGVFAENLEVIGEVFKDLDMFIGAAVGDNFGEATYINNLWDFFR